MTNPQARTRVVIDTDPGIDDAAAIALALAADEIELLGLTTVAGNSPLEHTTLNALRFLELASSPEVPVAAGANRALVQGPRKDPGASVHGQDGFGGVLDFEPARGPIGTHGADFIAQTAAEAPITLVAIGPLTNVALALAMHPEVADRIERILIMGGARLEGNVTPAAEFNIWADPEAAARVFDSGIPLVVLPLDVTHDAILTDAELDRMAGSGKVGKALAEMVRYYEGKHIDEYGNHFAPLHDVLAVLPLVVESAITFEEAEMHVDAGSSASRGATLVSVGGRIRTKANGIVGLALDREVFATTLLEHVARLG